MMIYNLTWSAVPFSPRFPVIFSVRRDGGVVGVELVRGFRMAAPETSSVRGPTCRWG